VLVSASVVGPLGMATASAQSAPASPAPVETATLSGFARDTGGGVLSGVTITLTGPVTKSTTTGKDGAYGFSGLPSGIYTVTAVKDGFDKAEQTDVPIISGNAGTLDVTLVGSTLSSLRTIGSVSTQATRSGFNISGLSVSTITAQRIQDRNLPNLNYLVQELPGVTIFQDSGSRTPNTNFVIRGSEIETATVIDGHALSSGVFGTYNTNYANPDIFNSVEVLKGAGLNGIYGGVAGVGVINLQTKDFSSQNSAFFKTGLDNYQGSMYTGGFNYNLLNGRVQILGVRVYQGTNGPNLNSSQYQLGAAPTTSASQLGGAGGNYTGGPGLITWASNYADPYVTQANLLKLRVKITPDIWLTGEYLGLYGAYVNQGGSYGLYYGTFPVAACGNLSSKGAVTPVAAGAGGCTVASVYNAPYIPASQIGQNANYYGYFPNSSIANNEPTFSAELRAKLFSADTLFFRPYSAIIDRFINGNLENTQPGYGSAPSGAAAGWYQVVNPANCQVAFKYSATGSYGPCFSGGNYSTPYVGNPAGQYPTVFPTSSTVPNCSPTSPCWTTPTNQQNSGQFGYNTPFSQPEVDRERGFTASYLHPYKDDLFNLSFDYSKDDTIKFSGDTSPVSAGCYNVVATGKIANNPTYTPPGSTTPIPNPYYQPNCTASNGMILPFLPSNALQIPPTQSYQYLSSASGLFQATDQLQLGAALYYTFQKINYQMTDPAAAAAAAAAGQPGAEQANATLIGGVASHSSINPHFQAQFRATPDFSIRANAGSSVTLPYNGLVSGFTSLSPNGGPSGQDDVLTGKNPNLLPETVVAYDLGFDLRASDGSILSSDVYDNTVHNVFVTQTTVVPNLPGRTLPPGAQTLLNTTLNGPLERSYGLEVTFSKNPSAGFGYTVTGSLNRAYYDQFGLAFYESLNGSTTTILNGKQLDGTSSFTSQIPYFKGLAEVNYRTENGRSGWTLGDSYYGNNNSTGGPPYFYAYGSIYTTVAKALRLSLSCQNLFNYNTGTFTANDYAFAGFNPLGSKLVNGNVVVTNAYSTPNGIVSVPPRTLYFTAQYNI
jgi:outer membrane receptor protein involved in Fe transport